MAKLDFDHTNAEQILKRPSSLSPSVVVVVVGFFFFFWGGGGGGVGLSIFFRKVGPP